MDSTKPVIFKTGTIDCDIVETTPIVYRGKLIRYEYIRQLYWANTEGMSYSRFVDVETGETITAPFARGFHFGSAFVENDTVYVFAVDQSGSSRVTMFASEDLVSWRSDVIIDLPGWGFFNNSVCRTDDGYVIALEIDRPPEETGVMFTIRFARSKDLLHWTMTDKECVFTKEKYSACPAIRYFDGLYYMIYLEANPGPTCSQSSSYESWIVRSGDLVRWEGSPFNPILAFSKEDRIIKNTQLPAPLLERIGKVRNINNSDVDLCEFRGRTYIYYSWGCQCGTEHLAGAVYEGTMKSLLEGYFDGEIAD